MSESASDKRGRSKTRPKKRAERSDQAVPVNKTLEIRKVARQMVAVGKPPRPIDRRATQGQGYRYHQRACQYCARQNGFCFSSKPARLGAATGCVP